MPVKKIAKTFPSHIKQLRSLSAKSNRKWWYIGITLFSVTITGSGILYLLFSRDKQPEPQQTAPIEAFIEQNHAAYEATVSKLDAFKEQKIENEDIFLKNENHALTLARQDTKNLITIESVANTKRGLPGYTQPQKNNQRLTYNNIYSGVDLHYTVDNNKVIEEYELQSKFVIDEFSQRINLNGLVLEELQDGSLLLKSGETGEIQFAFHKPVMYEKENPANRHYGVIYEIVEVQGETYLVKTITPEGKAWLEESANYPVIISETISLTLFGYESYPIEDGEWKIRLDTVGQGELQLTPGEGTSLGEGDNQSDLSFAELRCGESAVEPAGITKEGSLVQEITFTDFECAEEAQLTLKQNVAKVNKITLTYGEYSSTIQNYQQGNKPLITSIKLNPAIVYIGDKMTITAKVQDAVGVTKVTANMADIDTVNLQLKHGSAGDGVWEGTWIVRQTKPIQYPVTVTAYNSLESSTSSVAFFDPPPPGITWDGGAGDGLWSSAANWSGDVLPGSTDVVIFNGTNTANVSIDQSIDVQGIYIESTYTGTVTQAAGSNIILGTDGYTQDGGTFTGSVDTITISGDFTQTSGTFTAPAQLDLTGDWAVWGGTFNHNSGTVGLTGTNQQLYGSTTFNNLSKVTSTTSTLSFPGDPAQTQTIIGTLTLQGSESTYLSLRSSAPGTPWRIDPQGSRNVNYLDVQDSTNVNGTTISITHFTDSGNNTGWTTIYTCLDGGDHQGQNWNPATDCAGGEVAGHHYNIGDLTVGSGETVSVKGFDGTDYGSFAIDAVNADITGTITANGKGYAGGDSNDPIGDGPGGGEGVCSGRGGGGAYGGNGGNSSSNDPGGTVYNAALNPINLGSGGGCGSNNAPGGNGGGVVKLIASGTISISGTVSSNGGSASSIYAGGGAGGGIYLNASTIQGTGSISANGGIGGSSGGGDGGGGRVYISYTSANSFAGTLTANTGTNTPGEDGTIVIHDATSNDLYITTSQTWRADPVLEGSVHTFNDVYVQNNTTWTLKGYYTNDNDGVGFEFNVNNFTVDSGAAVATIGYPGGNSNSTNGYGTGGGEGYCSNRSGGGGHGGKGGDASNGREGGIVYGKTIMPTTLGSGGGCGHGSSAIGGDGGGALTINGTGAVTVNGTLRSDGFSGIGSYTGAGAGGSIAIIASTIDGSGSITANGANGGSNGGGDGGGGRLYVSYETNNFTGTLAANTGTNFPGDDGTLLIVDSLNNDLYITASQIWNADPAREGSQHTYNTIYVQNNATWTLQGFYTNDTDGIGFVFNVSNFNLDAGSTIKTTGFAGGDSLDPYGDGPGGGEGNCSGRGGGGAYGGDAGDSSRGDLGGTGYGSALNPIYLGSGGGCGATDLSSDGGGAIKIVASQMVTVNGTIDSDGEIADGSYSGGGSGGSIYIDTNDYTGSGVLTANGGDSNSTDGGGAGGGGRILITYTGTNTYTGTVSSLSGSTRPGENGTVASLDETNNDLFITQTQNWNAAPSLDGTQHNYRNVHVENNAIWTLEGHYTNDTDGVGFTFDVTNFYITSGSTVQTSGYGASRGPGQGADGLTSGSRGQGAGYGGAGAQGSGGPSEDATGKAGTYGSASAPIDLGSGGGYGVDSVGGTGGGAVKISAQGTIQVAGTLSSNGYTGEGYAGGGSGGSVYLLANTLEGSGDITANAGCGGPSSGGSGGGGRISIIYTTSNTHTGAVTADNNGCSYPGDAGTVIINSSNAPVLETLDQKDLNCSNSINLGDDVYTTSVCLTVSAKDSDTTDSLTLEVELQPHGTAFTGIANYQSSPAGSVADTSLNIDLPVSSLTDGEYYHWRARVLDSNGLSSSWIEFDNGTGYDFRTIVPSKFLIQLPGQTFTDGSGVTGTPDSQLTGLASAASYAYVVNQNNTWITDYSGNLNLSTDDATAKFNSSSTAGSINSNFSGGRYQFTTTFNTENTSGGFLITVSQNSGPSALSSGTSSPVLVYPRPTAPSYVYDGLGSDEDLTNSTTTLSAHWDSVALINGYEYAIGTSPGGTQLVSWTDVGLDTSFTRTDLTLITATTYYVSARTYDSNGPSEATTSDGIFVDNVSPVIPSDMLQYQNDGVTLINEGELAATNRVVLESNIYDTGGADRIYWDIELLPQTSTFTGTPNRTVTVSSYTTGTLHAVSTTFTGLDADQEYKWQTRTRDRAGNTSAWTAYGSDANLYDFKVDKPTQFLIQMPGQSFVEGSGITGTPSTAQTGVTGTTAYIYAVNNNNELKPYYAANINLSTDDTLAEFDDSGVAGSRNISMSNGVGTFTVKFMTTSTPPGWKIFAVQNTGEVTMPNAESDYVIVSTGAVDPDTSTITADTLTQVADGTQVITITVTLQDSAGNPVSGKEIAPTVSGSNNTVSTPPLTDSNGQSSFTISSTKAENKTITVEDSTDSIVLNTTVDVTFVAGVPSPSLSTVTVSPTSLEANGTDTSTITVILRDAYNNPVSGRTVQISATGTGNIITQPASVTNSSGQATGTIASTDIGSKTISITIVEDSLQLDTQPAIDFTPGAASATRSTVAVSKTSVIADNSDSVSITVTVNDENDNPIQGKSITIYVTGNSNNLVPVSGTSDSNGQVTATLTSTRAELKTISAENTTDNHFIVQTQDVTFIAGALSQSASTVDVSTSTALANNSDTVTVSIALKDQYNNPISGEQVTIAATGTGNTLVQPASATDGSGVTIGYIRSYTVETKIISATVTNGGIVLSDTAEVTFEEVLFDQTQSTVEVDNYMRIADNIEEAIVTITLRDAAGNPLPGKEISISATGTSNTITQPGYLTDTNGQTSATIASTKAELKTISATSITDGLDLEDTAEVEFVAGSVSSSNSSLSANTFSLPADGNSTSTVTVTLRDQYDNPVQGKTITISATGSDNTISQPTSLTNAFGATNGSIKSTKAEIKTISATVVEDGITLPMTIQITFTAGETDLQRSTLTVDKVTALADSIDTVTITITLYDQYDNPIPDKDITIYATGTGNAIIQPAGPTDASGVVTATLTSSDPGIKTISATNTTDALSIDETADVVFLSGGREIQGHITGTNISDNSADTATAITPTIHFFTNTPLDQDGQVITISVEGIEVLSALTAADITLDGGVTALEASPGTDDNGIWEIDIQNEGIGSTNPVITITLDSSSGTAPSFAPGVEHTLTLAASKVKTSATPYNYPIIMQTSLDLGAFLFYVSGANEVVLGASIEPYIAFTIRNSGDTGDLILGGGPGVCNLTPELLETTNISSCSYRLKVTTNSVAGYIVSYYTTGMFSNGSHTFADALGTGILTAGIEGYGITLDSGYATNGTVYRGGSFGTNASYVYPYSSTTETTLYTSDGMNGPAGTDTTNTALITHQASVDPSTPSGAYSQTATYIVTAQF
ncbi:MAG: beta strand repeat-containing protein [Candidatus Dojkabacteria bacterium]